MTKNLKNHIVVNWYHDHYQNASTRDWDLKIASPAIAEEFAITQLGHNGSNWVSVHVGSEETCRFKLKGGKILKWDIVNNTPGARYLPWNGKFNLNAIKV